MKIRPIEDGDFESVARIYNLSKLDELRFELDKFELLPLEHDQRRLRELLEADIYVYYDGGILGYGAVCGQEIRALFVHPTARNQGIGSSLLEHLLSQTNDLVRLYIAKTNAPARVLYEKYGFRIASEFETSYNGQSVLANEMTRSGSQHV
jgi:putative acetyltransferase